MYHLCTPKTVDKVMLVSAGPVCAFFNYEILFHTWFWLIIVCILILCTQFKLFFSEKGQPSLCIEEMHTALLYFIYSTQAGKKALQRSYKLKPLQTQVSKWYVQNVSTFPNTFAIVSPLIYVFWIQQTRTNTVFSRIALVSCFYAEIQLSGKIPKNPAKFLFYQKTHGARI
jgi:hypothetical protein